MDWNKTGTTRNRQVVKVWSGSKTLSKADRGYMGTRESLPLPYESGNYGQATPKQSRHIKYILSLDGAKRKDSIGMVSNPK